MTKPLGELTVFNCTIDFFEKYSKKNVETFQQEEYMAKDSLKPIFKKPYGESQSEHSFGHSRTEGPILCELCGTTHPDKSEERYSYTWGMIFGRQYVEECCGKLVEELYEQFARVFVEAFLEDFSDNPTDIRFGFLRHMLPDIMEKAHQKVNEIPLMVASVSA